MKFPMKIEGKRVFLQHPAKPTFALATELFATIDASRDTLSKWLPWPKNTKRPEDEFGALLDWDQKWQEKKSFAYIIRDIKTKKILGMIEFMFADTENKSGEIGYWLSSKVEGCGYMSEALKLFEDVIFGQGFNRILIRNDTRNTRSVNVAARAGYHLDGVLRQVRWSSEEKCFISLNLWSKLKSDLEA